MYCGCQFNRNLWITKYRRTSGTTNRLDLIDPALLRPGRFDLQIEINLPSRKGRIEILKIHTEKMAKRGHLSEDVNLEEIASMAEGEF